MEIPFSGRLISSLYYMTDVGPIPRSFKPGETPAPTFYSSPNWRRSIQGCYWCCTDNVSHQTICCSTKCLMYLHEWCVFKVNDLKRNEFICRYPGCDQDHIEKNSFCTDEHASAFQKGSSGLLDPSTDFNLIRIGPKWYDIDPQFNSVQFSKKRTSTSYSSDQVKSECSDVMMQGTEASLFIFSPRLYEGLIFRTDVGPIPRDSKCQSHLSSQFATYRNWCVTIEGCYWCGKQLTKDYSKYLYVCDKKCYSLLHEWCRRKYQHATGNLICLYPGCDQFIDKNEFCSEEHLQKLEADYKTIYNTLVSGLSKDPPWYNKSSATSLIPQSESCTNVPSLQQPQIPFLLSRVLSEFLIFQTDIGPIPRGLIQYAGEIHIRPQVLQSPSNWNIVIPGCYWCCNSLINPYNQLFCSPQCFYLFNEWCHNKYRQIAGGSCCKYLSCENTTHSSSSCCNLHYTLYASEFDKFSQLLTSTQFILGPKWYNNHSLEMINFYNREEPFYEFTNFFPCNSLTIDGVYFPTSEHYFQSQKFVGTPYTKFMSQLSAPRDALDFGRKKEVTRWMRPDWDAMREHVMYTVLKEKFTQNHELGELLINTCNATLYEHTSNDSFWGDGGNRMGQNKLGKLLMKLRSELQSQFLYFPTTLQHHTFLYQNNNNSNQILQNNFPTADGSGEWIDEVKPQLPDNQNQSLNTINFRLEATAKGTFMKSQISHHDMSSSRDVRPPAYNPAFANQPSPGSAVMDCVENEPIADDTMDT